MLMPEFSDQNSNLSVPVSPEAEYQQACTDFRQLAAGRLAAAGALRNGQGWATYDIVTEDPGSLAMADGQVDALLLSYFPDPAGAEKGEKFSSIRLVTNETIVGLNGHKSFLTRDFVVDYENDAIYFVGAIDEGTLTGETPDSRPPTASFFQSEEGGRLYFGPGFPFTAPYCLFVNPSGQESTNISPSSIKPFGDFHTLSDKWHALKEARVVLDQMTQLQPTHTIIYTS
jgi:hypothetical protein